jgi:hypothetical protein
VRISISGISAKCPGCGAADFIPDGSSRPGRQDFFNCARCGAEARYAELLRRISEESKRRAKAKSGADHVLLTPDPGTRAAEKR